MPPYGSQARSSQMRSSQVFSRGKGKSIPGPGIGFHGRGKSGAKRHRRILKDNIRGITKNDIRRLARRGGVKRISGLIYDDVRSALRARLELILREATFIVEYANRKTITAHDIIFILRRLGSPIYGFDPATAKPHMH